MKAPLDLHLDILYLMSRICFSSSVRYICIGIVLPSFCINCTFFPLKSSCKNLYYRAYGNDKASRYNGVVVIGNHISPYNISEKNGLKFTDFNRTLSDALANEQILDMQGTMEALNKYYYTNGESFNGLSVSPEYQARFESLTNEAIEYYDE